MCCFLCMRKAFCQSVPILSTLTLRVALLGPILKKTVHLSQRRILPILSEFHLSHVTPVPVFSESVFFEVCRHISLREISQFFHGGHKIACSFSWVYFLAPLFHLLSGTLQSTNCRFPQWPSLFPPVNLRDICGACCMHVRPLNEKSNLEILSVQIELKEIFFFQKVNHFLLDGPNTPFGVTASVSSAFKINVFSLNVLLRLS